MFWQNLYSFLYYYTDTPQLFGAFHIASFVIIILATILAAYLLKNAEEKTFRRFCLVVWIVLAVGEIYREICYSSYLADGKFVWDYAWFQFPFHLCSSPLYFLPFVAFLKDGRARDAFLCFMSLWSFLGGAIISVYASPVLCGYVGINIQSMIHHGAMVMVGVIIAVRNGRRMDKKYFLRGLIVYLIYIAIAMLLNVVVYHLLRANGMNDTFNMLFMSPYFECGVPVVAEIWAATSWLVAFLVYVVGFFGFALLIFFIQRALVRKFGKSA